MSMVASHVWKPLDRPELGVINAISETIRSEEWRHPDLLTSVRHGPSLIVGSDYSGEHNSSAYFAISILVADGLYLWYWIEQSRELRLRILRDSRRLSFKNLTEKRRSRMLVPFLRLCNTIPGQLVTFLVEKRIKSLFFNSKSHPRLSGEILDRSKWTQRSLEKLFRVAHFGSLLVAGLSEPNQNVLWITDEDEIVANLTKHREATNVLADCMSDYLHHEMGHFRLATTKSDDDSRILEDYVAIPDLAAGSLSEVVTYLAAEGGLSQVGLLKPLGNHVSSKAHAVLAWLAETQHPLKKLTFIVEHVPLDNFKVYLLRTGLDAPIPEYNWRPEFLRHSQRQHRSDQVWRL